MQLISINVNIWGQTYNSLSIFVVADTGVEEVFGFGFYYFGNFDAAGFIHYNFVNYNNGVEELLLKVKQFIQDRYNKASNRKGVGLCESLLLEYLLFTNDYEAYLRFRYILRRKKRKIMKLKPSLVYEAVSNFEYITDMANYLTFCYEVIVFNLRFHFNEWIFEMNFQGRNPYIYSSFSYPQMIVWYIKIVVFIVYQYSLQVWKTLFPYYFVMRIFLILLVLRSIKLILVIKSNFLQYFIRYENNKYFRKVFWWINSSEVRWVNYESMIIQFIVYLALSHLRRKKRKFRKLKPISGKNKKYICKLLWWMRSCKIRWFTYDSVLIQFIVFISLLHTSVSMRDNDDVNPSVGEINTIGVMTVVAISTAVIIGTIQSEDLLPVHDSSMNIEAAISGTAESENVSPVSFVVL